jgi:hypothetical protein
MGKTQKTAATTPVEPATPIITQPTEKPAVSGDGVTPSPAATGETVVEQPAVQTSVETPLNDTADIADLNPDLHQQVHLKPSELAQLLADDAEAAKQSLVDELDEQEEPVDWKEKIQGYFETYPNQKEFWVGTVNEMVFLNESDAQHYVRGAGGEVIHVER